MSRKLPEHNELMKSPAWSSVSPSLTEPNQALSDFIS